MISDPWGCIDAFREARRRRYLLRQRLTPSNDPNEGAAIWGYKINTAFISRTSGLRPAAT